MIIKRHSQIKTYFMDDATDGTYQAISLPTGVDAESVLITVHDGGSTSYDPDVNGVGFQFSHDSDGSDGFIISGVKGLLISSCIGGEVIGYVKAATGNKICLSLDNKS